MVPSRNFLRDDEQPLAYGRIRLRYFIQKLVPEREDDAVLIFLDETMQIENSNESHNILLVLSDFQQEQPGSSRKLSTKASLPP